MLPVFPTEIRKSKQRNLSDIPENKIVAFWKIDRNVGYYIAFCKKLEVANQLTHET